MSSQIEFYLCLVLVGLLSAVTFYCVTAIIYAMAALYSDKPLSEKKGFDEDFIHEEAFTVASVLPIQRTCVNGAEFDAPESDGLSADGDTTLSQ